MQPRACLFVNDAGALAMEGNENDGLALSLELVDLAENERLIEPREACDDHGDGASNARGLRGGSVDSFLYVDDRGAHDIASSTLWSSRASRAVAAMNAK